jgi:uncharacterized membrane-anchored protein
MMRKNLLLAVLLLGVTIASAQEIDSLQLMIDEIESNMEYQTGEIDLDNGIGKLQVPGGFKYLDKAQSNYVLEDLWGNPNDPSVLGMLFPETSGVIGDAAWGFIITYEEMGFVKDDDADDIDYDDLLEEMQNDTKAANEERVKEGYEAITLVGWAAKPFYDEKNKVLHWAKELKFGEADFSTLNYNIRILGRKGVVVLNAVASMEQLPEVQKTITPVLSSFTYADGNKYSDFNPDLDEVAAWTIGGLVAGKVLAKVGILAFVLKYIKLIGIAIAALCGAAWKWYKRKTELPEVRNIEETTKVE